MHNSISQMILHCHGELDIMLEIVCGTHIADVAWRHPGLAIYILVPQVLPEAAHATALGPQRVV